MTASGGEAAALIWRLWQAGEATDALPAAQRPGTRAEGYAIQAHLEPFSKKPRYGWKIAARQIARSSAGNAVIRSVNRISTDPVQPRK